MRRNIKQWVRRNYNKEESGRYMQNVKTLLWANSEKDMDDLLNRYCPNDFRVTNNTTDLSDTHAGYESIGDSDEELADEVSVVDEEWDDKFRAYYFAYQDKDFRSSFRGRLASKGIFNVNSGITNNPSENINSILKRYKLEDNPTLYNTIRQISKWQNTLLYDISKALKRERGNLKVSEKHQKKAEKVPPVELKGSIIRFPDEDREVQLPKAKQRLDWDINWGSFKQEAMDYINNEAVHHLQKYGKGPSGVWIVETETNDFLVTPEKKSCTCGKRRCPHLLAVRIFTGNILNDPKGKDMITPPTNLTDVYNLHAELAGKKRGHRRQRAKFDTETLSWSSGSGSNSSKSNSGYSNVYKKDFNIEPVNLLTMTAENCRKKLLNVGGVWLSLIDLKSIRADALPEEIECVKYKPQPSDLSKSELQAEDLPREGEDFRPGWMTDNAIYAYIHSISDKSSSRLLSPIETMFVLNNVSGANSDTASNLFQQRPHEVAYKDTKLLHMPVQVHNNHWILIAANPEDKLITVADSLGYFKLGELQKANLTLFLNTAFGNPVNTSWQVQHPRTALQRDGRSCGPYVCFYAKMLESKASLSYAPPENFQDEIMVSLVGQCNLDRAIDFDSEIDVDLYECDTCGSANESKSGADKFVNWIQCNKCRNWRHLKHTRLTQEEADEARSWFCT